jgi:hypothetical protein
MKAPLVISLLGMIGGVIISIVFGANEGIFKDKIQAGLLKNEKIQSIADEGARAEKMKVEADKNWRYYQRYHFHATGVGSMTMAVLIFLGFVTASKKQILTAAYMISIGGFLYPFVWLFAGIYGPEMGRDQAKEAFALFGYMGGVCLLGMIFAAYLAISKPLKAPLGKA